MKKEDVKKIFNQIEYPKDQIGSVQFGIISKNKDIEMRVALIERGNIDDTVDQIFDDYADNYDIVFKPNEICNGVINALKAKRNVPLELIENTYENTKDLEHMKFIEDGNYIIIENKRSLKHLNN